jgi:hypothetical protein
MTKIARLIGSVISKLYGAIAADSTHISFNEMLLRGAIGATPTDAKNRVTTLWCWSVTFFVFGHGIWKPIPDEVK